MEWGTLSEPTFTTATTRRKNLLPPRSPCHSLPHDSDFIPNHPNVESAAAAASAFGKLGRIVRNSASEAKTEWRKSFRELSSSFLFRGPFSFIVSNFPRRRAMRVERNDRGSLTNCQHSTFCLVSLPLISEVFVVRSISSATMLM